MCLTGPSDGIAGGLVAAVGVEFEAAHETPVDVDGGVGGVEDDFGGLAGVTRADADLEGPDVEASSGADHGPDASLRRGDRFPGHGGSLGAEALERGDASDRAMRPLGVVVVREDAQRPLELGNGSQVPSADPQPFLLGLLEPFDLAARLGMERSGVDLHDACSTQAGFEDHFAAAEPPRERQPVVRQTSARQSQRQVA